MVQQGRRDGKTGQDQEETRNAERIRVIWDQEVGMCDQRTVNIIIIIIII